MTIFDTASTVANGVAVSARPNRSIRSARDSGGASAAIPDALVSPSFERNVLISRIDEDVRALWGVKAAVRVLGIATSGSDGRIHLVGSLQEQSIFAFSLMVAS